MLAKGDKKIRLPFEAISAYFEVLLLLVLGNVGFNFLEYPSYVARISWGYRNPEIFVFVA